MKMLFSAVCFAAVGVKVSNAFTPFKYSSFSPLTPLRMTATDLPKLQV